MQIINCTYRGSRARYYVSKPYPYYDTEQLTVEVSALDGSMYTGLAELPAEELTVGLIPLSSELRSLTQSYNASTGAIDGSTAVTSGNVEAVVVQGSALSGELIVILYTQTQPTEAASVSLDALNGTLVQILLTHTQPIEAVDINLTALDGTLI